VTIASQGRQSRNGAAPEPMTHVAEDQVQARSTEVRDPESAEGSPWLLLTRYRNRALALDGLSAVVGAGGGYLWRFGLHHRLSYIAMSILLPPMWMVLVTLQRGYEQRFLGSGPEEYRRVADAGMFLFTVIAVFSYAIRGDISRGFVLISVPVTVVLTLLVRKMLRTWLYKLRAGGVGLQKVLVVGRADGVVAVIEKLDHEPQHGLVAVGACVPPGGISVSHVHGVPVVGAPSGILEAVDATGAHVVAVVSHPDLSGQALRRLSWALEERNVELVVSPGIVEVAGPRLSIRPIAGLSLLHLERPSARGGKMLMKAVFDRSLGGALLLVSSPAFVVAAAAVALTSRGPVLFRQTRIGVDGQAFTMLKFRSMVVDAEQRKPELAQQTDAGNEMLFKMRSDPRVTRVGGVLRRFSLDELPQLINVVRGDMSLVGPRPPLPEEVAVYSADATRRLRVRPGLTGLWQVSGRSDLSWEESLRLDLRYVDNWSMALDLSILWRTWRAVLHGSGAY
jgi:exopolysaccharide biosynthesis polyprenyl glycosylphosphotransferase